MLDSLAAWSPGDRARGKAGMEEGQGRAKGRVLESVRAAQGRCESNGSKRAGKGTHAGHSDNGVELAPWSGRALIPLYSSRVTPRDDPTYRNHTNLENETSLGIKLRSDLLITA